MTGVMFYSSLVGGYRRWYKADVTAINALF